MTSSLKLSNAPSLQSSSITIQESAVVEELAVLLETSSMHIVTAEPFTKTDDELAEGMTARLTVDLGGTTAGATGALGGMTANVKLGVTSTLGMTTAGVTVSLTGVLGGTSGVTGGALGDTTAGITVSVSGSLGGMAADVTVGITDALGVTTVGITCCPEHTSEVEEDTLAEAVLVDSKYGTSSSSSLLLLLVIYGYFVKRI